MELSRRPLAYRAVVLCLNSVFREEIGLVSLIKQQMRHIDVYLSQTDGRQASLVEATRRGADGILSDEGLHRFDGPAIPAAARSTIETPLLAERPGLENRSGDEPDHSIDGMTGEAVLTAEELRALLQEQPSLPPGADS
jgi:hypothetical protein